MVNLVNVVFLGSTKVQAGNRVTLTTRVIKELNVKLGTPIIFEKDNKGNLIIRKG